MGRTRSFVALLATAAGALAMAIPLESPATPLVTEAAVGSGDPGCTTGAVTAVRLYRPSAAVVGLGGEVYVADADNHRLLVGRPGPSGELVMQPYGGACGAATFAGDGQHVHHARFHYPIDLAVDRHGNLYVADTYNHRIRRVDAATGTISTVAGSGQVGSVGEQYRDVDARTASLAYPHGITVSGDELLIADSFAHRILTVDLVTGRLSNEPVNLPPRGLRGPRPQPDSLFVPTAVRLDPSGQVLYVADAFHRRVLRVDRLSGFGHVYAGAGAREARPVVGPGDLEPAERDVSLVYPFSIEVDGAGNLYVLDSGRGTVSLVAPGGLLVPVVGLAAPPAAQHGGDVDSGAGPDFPDRGDDRAALLAYLGQPGHLHLDAGGDLWLADRLAHRVRRVPVVDCLDGHHLGVALWDATGGFYDNGDPVPGHPWATTVSAGCDVATRTVRGTTVVGASSSPAG